MVESAFKSKLAPRMISYLEQRQQSGFNIRNHAGYLREFDQMLFEHLDTDYLTKEAFEAWDAMKPYLSNRSKVARHNIIRMFARFAFSRDGMSYVPDTSRVKSTSSFMPYIFTKEELSRIISAADRLEKRPNAPTRHLVIPAVMRMLYSCGFRISELLELKMNDFDFEIGTVIIRHAKNGKDRIVPIHDSMMLYLQSYISELPDYKPDAWLFPSQYGHYEKGTVYQNFRELLFMAGIPHRGCGHGPRVHDLRHTFAVHSLEAQISAGYSLMEILPRLAAYMGHSNYQATCVYLHLTAEVFPKLTRQIEIAHGALIPELGCGDDEED